jgi:hypothetical protein
MDRRTLLKQSAAVAAGIATGALVGPVVDSAFPGAIGADVANGEDLSAFAVAWHDKTGEIYHLESFVIDRPPFDYNHIAREWSLSPAEVKAISDEDRATMAAFDHIQSILDEIDKGQSPWGKVMKDIMEQELTQPGICFSEVSEAFDFDQGDTFKAGLEKLASFTDEAKVAMKEYGIENVF